MKNVVLSTRNRSKLFQIQAMFTSMPVNLLTLDDANIAGEAVEDGETLEENAHKKAAYAHARVPPFTWTMAEDTGLFIDALGGEPGVRAARWAGEGKDAEEVMRHALKRLVGIADRSATFRTVVVLMDPDGKEQVFSGSAQGRILTQPRTPPPAQMPYSAIFVPDGSERAFSEMSPVEMNLVSHRGRAFAQLIHSLARLP
jgi:XTP/dITP diphosphohydrolase